MHSDGSRGRFEAEFAAFVSARGAALVGLGYALSGDRGVGEDLAQEALSRCWARWRRHRLPEHPAAYARRSLVNVFLSQRRLRRSTELVGTPNELSISDHSAQQAERDMLWRALTRLSPSQRSVLVLRYYEDLPDDAIADLLGCAPATVRSHAFRALDTLRRDQSLSPTEGADR